MTLINSWTVEELTTAYAHPLGVRVEAGTWYILDNDGNAPGAISLADVGIYDLTMAGNAYLVADAALQLGRRRLTASQQLRAAQLASAAVAAMDSGEPVRLTCIDFTDLDLAPYVDKDDFGAALMFNEADRERATALFIFGNDERADFRA